MRGEFLGAAVDHAVLLIRWNRGSAYGSVHIGERHKFGISFDIDLGWQRTGAPCRWFWIHISQRRSSSGAQRGQRGFCVRVPCRNVATGVNDERVMLLS